MNTFQGEARDILSIRAFAQDPVNGFKYQAGIEIRHTRMPRYWTLGQVTR
jgi:hypothetical protein